jgi:hypothetical protein
MPQSLNVLLTNLEATKSLYSHDTAAETKSLLDQLSTRIFEDTTSLLRFHETLLFLRAFPQSQAVVAQTEKLLNTFHQRIELLRTSGADMEVLDDFDASGLAGTTMQDTLNFEAARWLARRIPSNVEIAWEDYEEERAMGSTWPRFIPLLEEDADVEANIPWRRWLDTARGRERDFGFLIRHFEQLPTTPRARAELYDSLRLPLRWHLKNLKLSRTRNWARPRRLFIHTEPLITRSQVSLASELSQPLPRLTKLSRREGEQIMHFIREVMVVRYRELYGTTLGDPASVVRADLGRGVVMYFWNLPPDRRLPLRAYVAGFTLKNGVPINYIEAIGLCEWIEVGFNTFYTYRQGETAWIYAQALRCLHAYTKATTISIYPYQIGQQNDEALDSGAFWFYRKLGFRSGDPVLEKLARSEEQKIAANPKYRTPKKTLKRLAEAHVFYEIATPTVRHDIEAMLDARRNQSRSGARMQPTACPELVEGAQAVGKLTSSNQAPKGRMGDSGPWDTFSTRTLALRVNRRMAREFSGDATKLRDSSMKQITRALRLNPKRWTTTELQALENWSLILAMIPDLATWSPQEKRELIKLIQSQASPNEMHYLRETQRHSRLRHTLLRLGSA